MDLKRNLIFISTLFLVLLLLTPDASAISFKKLQHSLDTKKNTKAYVKQYWKDVKGTEVFWEGKLIEVKSWSGRKFKVFMRVGSPELEYNVVFSTKHKAVARLKKGKTITFSGFLYDYKWGGARQIKKYIETDDWIRDLTIVLTDGRLR